MLPFRDGWGSMAITSLPPSCRARATTGHLLLVVIPPVAAARGGSPRRVQSRILQHCPERRTPTAWANQAIARTTPCLLALFSLVTLLADRLVRQGPLPLPPDAWYTKARPTFADALAAVRQHYWRQMGFRLSRRQDQMGKLPPTLRESLIYALCRAG